MISIFKGMNKAILTGGISRQINEKSLQNSQVIDDK